MNARQANLRARLRFGPAGFAERDHDGSAVIGTKHPFAGVAVMRSIHGRGSTFDSAFEAHDRTLVVDAARSRAGALYDAAKAIAECDLDETARDAIAKLVAEIEAKANAAKRDDA